MCVHVRGCMYVVSIPSGSAQCLKRIPFVNSVNQPVIILEHIKYVVMFTYNTLPVVHLHM